MSSCGLRMRLRIVFHRRLLLRTYPVRRGFTYCSVPDLTLRGNTSDERRLPQDGKRVLLAGQKIARRLRRTQVDSCTRWANHGWNFVHGQLLGDFAQHISLWTIPCVGLGCMGIAAITRLLGGVRSTRCPRALS